MIEANHIPDNVVNVVWLRVKCDLHCAHEFVWCNGLMPYLIPSGYVTWVDNTDFKYVNIDLKFHETTIFIHPECNRWQANISKAAFEIIGYEEITNFDSYDIF